MKKSTKGLPVHRFPLRVRCAPLAVPPDTRTYLLMLYTCAVRRAGPTEFPDMQALLCPLAQNDRLLFFVHRQPVVLHVVCHPRTGAKALRYGVRIFGSCEEVAWNLRLDVRCGVSLRHEMALLDLSDLLV